MWQQQTSKEPPRMESLDKNAVQLLISPEMLGDQLPSQTQGFRTQMGQITRQSGIYFAGLIFTVATGYFFKVYLARVLGAEALGLYALGMTIVGFVGIFNALGLPQAALRFVPSYRASGKIVQLRSFLRQASLLLLCANLFFALALFKLGPWVSFRLYHSTALDHYFALFAMIMVLGALTGFLGKVLAGYQQVGKRTVIVSFIGGPLVMLATIFLIRAGYGLRGYLLSQTFAACVVLLLSLLLVRKLTPPAEPSPLPRSYGLERDVRSFSISVFGLGLMEFAMSQADKVTLGYYLGPRQVGIYAVAAALVAYVPVVLQSVNQVFSPAISDLHTRGEHVLLGRMFQTLTKWTFGLTLPLAFVIVMCARPLMRIFGVDFEAGWPILVIGTVGQLVNCGVGSVGYLLLMSGNERKLIKIQAVMTGVMIVANILLVPRLGIIGAALAAAITNVFSNGWYLREVSSVLHLHPYNRSYFRLLPPAAAAATAIFVVKRALLSYKSDWSVIAVSLLAAYLMFGLTTLLWGLNDDDRIIARAIKARLVGNVSQAPSVS